MEHSRVAFAPQAPSAHHWQPGPEDLAKEKEVEVPQGLPRRQPAPVRLALSRSMRGKRLAPRSALEVTPCHRLAAPSRSAESYSQAVAPRSEPAPRQYSQARSAAARAGGRTPDWPWSREAAPPTVLLDPTPRSSWLRPRSPRPLASQGATPSRLPTLKQARCRHLPALTGQMRPPAPGSWRNSTRAPRRDCAHLPAGFHQTTQPASRPRRTRTTAHPGRLSRTSAAGGQPTRHDVARSTRAPSPTP